LEELKCKKLLINLEVEVGGTIMDPSQRRNIHSRKLALKEGVKEE
jgi:hypothetical protein